VPFLCKDDLAPPEVPIELDVAGEPEAAAHRGWFPIHVVVDVSDAYDDWLGALDAAPVSVAAVPCELGGLIGCGGKRASGVLAGNIDVEGDRFEAGRHGGTAERDTQSALRGVPPGVTTRVGQVERCPDDGHGLTERLVLACDDRP
jgi:hypothetical protein